MEVTAERRRLFAALVAFIALVLVDLGFRVLAPGGWTVWEVLLFLCLLANAPWLGLSAATGILGAAIRLRGQAGAPAPTGGPLALRTLLAVCIRDEETDAVLPPLVHLLDGLAASGHGGHFALAILSDTADPCHAEAEGATISRFAEGRPDGAVIYRRREENIGYKAGNVMDFLDHHSAGFDLMLLLDADSEMTPEAVLRMVRAMEADPKLAILQSTISGRPAAAPFGRLLGAGHRPGSLTWAVGQDWWQEAEGPFWGHNALLRIAPFSTHCRLSPLPDGSHILSHDHVEAARLHAAGWAVRVLPDPSPEGAGSRESHPPNLPEFLVRDRRWAAGNLQYRHLLRDPSLGALGRFQMLQAILHYILGPLWFAMLPLAAINAAMDGEGTPRGPLVLLLVLGYAALHLPRLAGHAVALLQGAGWPYFRTALAESFFLLLFDPIAAFDKTLTVLAHAFGLRRGTWVAQHRAERRVSWREAAALLWPHTLAGLLILSLLALSGSAFAVLAGLPVLAGLLLAIPFCVLTAAPDAR
ncbi:glucans biosynthesis glucosyltransferase MdoH [Roseomonas sp. KE2513]|uniref:glucans biosynthesis glucosyltransferase MdoH n=1 Tax=Roseomonas sp. KE2513 TaxID=2479202 RepID=UPI002814B6A7|nr:glucans biosynthesis glucosyltransferase MdoH [Roseomonas sp. KE2513]